MPTSETDVTASDFVAIYLTDAAQDALLASSDSERRRSAWNRIIDQMLEWISNPELLGYPEIDPISRDLIHSAINYAIVARDALQPPIEPSAVGPTSDGGIAFEWRSGDLLRIIEIVDIGRGEVTEIRGGSVVSNYMIERDPRDRGWYKTE